MGELGLNEGSLASEQLDTACRPGLLVAYHSFSALLPLGQLGAEGQHSVVSRT